MHNRQYIIAQMQKAALLSLESFPNRLLKPRFQDNKRIAMPQKLMLFWAILLTSIHIKSVLSYLNQEQLKIVVDVIEKLEIRHCIFLQDEGDNRFHEIWKNMASKVFVTVFNKKKALAYYINDKYKHLSNHKAMVIINDEHSLITKELLKFNKRVSLLLINKVINTHQLRKKK